MVYRYTQDPRFLATAQQLADYFISHLPSDFVPYWDFSMSGTAPRDSSAAAIAAAGLLELSTYAATQTDRDRYRTAALNIQSSLSSPAYLGDRIATDGTLLHGTANAPGNSGIDISLIYGDYYFVQSCNRARTPPAAPTNLSASPTTAGQISLTWTAQTGSVRYSVKRAAISGGPYRMIAPPPILTANSYTDTNAAPGANYYVVSAINVSGESLNSAEVSANITSAPTSVTLTSSANPSVFGQAITFTASVQSTASGTPTGTITFRDGTAALGTATLTGNIASFTTAGLAAHSHSITALYAGNASFAGSTSPILTQSVSSAATSTALSSSPLATRFGQPLSLYATVSSTNSTVSTGSVTFKDGSTTLQTASVALGKAKISTSKLAVGSHPITALYAGTSNYVGSNSPVLTIVVSKVATTSTLTSSSNPSTFGAAVTFTAIVKASTGVAVTGTVMFKDGATTLGTVTLASGKATFTTALLTAGSHSVTAAFTGGTSFNSSVSTAVSQSVTP
jgi:hypothetical protein